MNWRLLTTGCLLLAACGCGDSQRGDDGSNAAAARGLMVGSGEDSGTSREPKRLSFAVIPKGTTHEFWKSVHAGAVNAANELGDIEILWKGPLLENDRDGQISVVQDFVTKQVDGICLAPLDKQALVDAVKDAHEAKIPVLIFDSALQDESLIVSYVATDNYKGGQLAAKTLGEALGGQGNVILLRYNPGSESTEQREQGFLDCLKEEFPDIHVLSSDEYAGTTPESSLDKATQVLNKYKDTVNGIFAVCEPNAAGVLKALEETGLATKVKFVAFDPNKELIQGMVDNKVHGIVLQDPVTMGYEAVKKLAAHLNGEKVAKRIGTGEYVATPKNMTTPEIDRLLKPQQFE
jgi:ribose transport system substrate-binding protein